MKSFYKTMLLASLMLVSTSAFAELQEPGLFFFFFLMTGKYVVLQNAMLADISGTEENAQVLNVDYNLQDNGEGIITTLNGGDGDMMETLDFIKNSFEMVLEEENYPTYFLDEMFTLHLVETGDADGSVYLCVDVPEIDNFDEIRDLLIEASDNQQAIHYYLTHMVPGNRHYLAVDYDDSFGFRVQNGEDSKWLMIPFEDTPTAIADVKAAQDANAPMYDIMGREVKNPSGIYIQNGKKMVK